MIITGIVLYHFFNLTKKNISSTVGSDKYLMIYNTNGRYRLSPKTVYAGLYHIQYEIWYIPRKKNQRIKIPTGKRIINRIILSFVISFDFFNIYSSIYIYYTS